MLVIGMCFYDYRARTDVGQGSMNVWDAMVFMIIACASKVIWIYGYGLEPNC